MEHPGENSVHALPDGRSVKIGPLPAERIDDLFVLFADIVARRDGYPHEPPLTRAAFEETWVRPVSLVVGAELSSRLAGAYYLKPNQPGLGAHIANAGYAIDRSLRGGGIGRLLVEDSVARAPLIGFDAIQFNFVFESTAARTMYERLGWREIGRIPDAVPAPGGGGRQAALIYWRAVGP
jgi:GNAT superfamily N-acetyltransferase